MHWLQDLLKRTAEPPQVAIDPKTDLAVAAVHRRHDRQSQGRDAHAPQPDRRADHGRRPPSRPSSTGKEVVLAFLPFFHIYGQVVIMLNGLCQGNLLVLFTSPDTEAILAAMERYRPRCSTACRRSTST